MRDGETSFASDKGNDRASAKDRDSRAAAPEVPPLDYDHVFLDLLDGAPACMIERIMRLYPDLPGRPSMSEAEALLRCAAHFGAS